MDEQLLIDKYLPEYSYREYHEIVVNSPIEDAYKIAKNLDLSKSRLIKTLFKIRGLPTRRMNLQDLVSEIGHTNIEERFPKENLFGAWGRTKIEPISSHKEFIDNAISARIKLVYNFRFSSLNATHTRLSTETRVLCVSSFTRLLFRLYWLIVRPFSGMIRIRMLRIIKEESELLHGCR